MWTAAMIALAVVAVGGVVTARLFRSDPTPTAPMEPVEYAGSAVVAPLGQPPMPSEVYIEIEPGSADVAPSLLATVLRPPAGSASQWSLSTGDVSVPASKLVPYEASTASLSIALVLEADDLWITEPSYVLGSDGTHVPADDATTARALQAPGVPATTQEGAFWHPGPVAATCRALTAGGLAHQPPNSDLTVFAYDDQPRLIGRGKTNDLDLASILTPLASRHGRHGHALFATIDAAAKQLAASAAARKLLVIVSDGVDDASPHAAQGIALTQALRSAHIMVEGVIYKGRSKRNNPNALAEVFSTLPVARTTDDIEVSLRRSIEGLAREQLLFPGTDPASGRSLPWDDKEHDVLLRVDHTALEPVEMHLPPWHRVARGR
jgi:hypothetical protein